MTKHYLCAIDLTHDEDARAILAEAGRLASLESADLSLVTVLPDYGSSFVGSFFQPGTLKDAAEAARKSLHKMAKDVLKGSDPQCIVEIGTVYEQVMDAAHKCAADHILVGAHKPDFTDRILGPNAARIARYAPVSVTVLRI